MIIQGDLILVLMEDALRAPRGQAVFGYSEVLILVLMEDALRGDEQRLYRVPM